MPWANLCRKHLNIYPKGALGFFQFWLQVLFLSGKDALEIAHLILEKHVITE